MLQVKETDGAHPMDATQASTSERWLPRVNSDFFAITLADCVTAVVAVLAFFYSKHTSAASRKQSSFDSLVQPLAQAYIEILEGQLRKLMVVSATEEESRVEAFDKLKATYPDWLDKVDDCYSKFDSALRTWKSQYRHSDNGADLRGVDVLFISGNAMFVSPVNAPEDVQSESFESVVEELAVLVNNSRDIIQNIERSRRKKFLWVF